MSIFVGFAFILVNLPMATGKFQIRTIYYNAMEKELKDWVNAIDGL